MRRIGLVILFITALAFGALWFAISTDATAQQNVQNPSEEFAGKAIIISLNDGFGGKPRQNVRVESMGDKRFLVYQVSDDGQKTYDYWTAIEKISAIKVFPNLDDANAFYESQIAKRPR